MMQTGQTSKSNFHTLGIQQAETSKERFAVLDSLNDKIRTKVDDYARRQI